MLLVALTGNYGMGKSSVLEVFGRLGAKTLDSDAIVADLLRRPAVIRKIERLLGHGVVAPDGRIDKREVARRVFNDPALRKRLEDLIHPLVFAELRSATRRLRGEPLLVVEVPLLFESGHAGDFDAVVTVYTTRKTALHRLRRSGVSHEDAVARMKVQLPISVKKRLADFRVNNEGPRAAVAARVARVLERLAERTGCPSRKGLVAGNMKSL